MHQSTNLLLFRHRQAALSTFACNRAYASLLNITMLFFVISAEKTKSAPTEADAQKTQTPIVAKLKINIGYAVTYQHRRNLHFYQIHDIGINECYFPINTHSY